MYFIHFWTRDGVFGVFVFVFVGEIVFVFVFVFVGVFVGEIVDGVIELFVGVVVLFWIIVAIGEGFAVVGAIAG